MALADAVGLGQDQLLASGVIQAIDALTDSLGYLPDEHRVELVEAGSQDQADFEQESVADGYAGGGSRLADERPQGAWVGRLPVGGEERRQEMPAVSMPALAARPLSLARRNNLGDVDRRRFPPSTTQPIDCRDHLSGSDPKARQRPRLLKEVRGWRQDASIDERDGERCLTAGSWFSARVLLLYHPLRHLPID